MANAEWLVESFAEVWEQRDANRYRELFHPEGTIFARTLDRAIGRDELPGHFGRILALVPDIHLRVEGWAANGDNVYVEWRITGTVAGKRLQWDGVDRFTLRGDKVIENVAFFDTLPLSAALDPSINRPR